jgi:two-component sensor histidine kinase
LRECLAAIGAGAIRSAGRGETIELIVKGDSPVVSADAAAALGIIVNELVNNAVVHGLIDRSSGRIGIEICREQGHTVIEVTDDGVGLPSEFSPPGTPDSGSGLGLVNSLVVYGLGGTMDIGESDGGGTRVRITF